MNATSLYVSTCRVIMLADADDQSSWNDLFRLVPYLRQSLSCTVCENLVMEPYTPNNYDCQHHVCKNCMGGRKKLKPPCKWCKDYENYTENLQLRMLLQCYKKLCQYFIRTAIYETLIEENEKGARVNGERIANSGLIELMQEGANFSDDYKSSAGLSESSYSILPCVYTNSASTQTQIASTSCSREVKSPSEDSSNSSAITNGFPVYSVMCAESGNKITIKRRASDDTDSPPEVESSHEENKTNELDFKKPSKKSRGRSNSKRKGCRCGNATATPGKLTCCGQRCPCYVDSKPCTECKCKGCRNPHRPDGMKVIPHTCQLDTMQLSFNSDSSPSCSGSVDSFDTDTLTVEAMEENFNFASDLKISITNVHSSPLHGVSSSLPAAFMMDEDLSDSSDEDIYSPPKYSTSSPIDPNYLDIASPQSGATDDAVSDVDE